MPATSSPTSSPTSSDTPKSTAPDDKAAEVPAEAPAPTFAVGQIAEAPNGALVLVVKVTPAEGDAGPIYQTVELPRSGVLNYYAEDLAEPGKREETPAP